MSRIELNNREASAATLQGGDLLFGRRSIVPQGAGKCSLVVEPKTPLVFEFSIIRVRLRTSAADPQFFYYFFASQAGRSLIGAIVTGTNVKGIRSTELKRLMIPLPSTEEQRAIAAALSDVDALIAALDALIAKKRDIKQATMQQLLTGKIRLPLFSEKWEVKRLGDYGRCLRGVSYKGDIDLSPYDTANTIRLLRSNNIQNGALITSDVQYVNAERVTEQQIMREGDILICMSNGSKELVGKAGIFAHDYGYGYTFGAFMGCFRQTTARANASFLFLLFHTARYRNYITNLLAGSSINNLRPHDIESLEFEMPKLAEQSAIVAILSDMDAEFGALEAKRDKTRALKQGIMQELLTGRIRLI